MQFVYRLEPDDIQALVEASGLRRRFGQPQPWLWYALAAVNVVLGVLWIAVLRPGHLLAGWYHWPLAAFAAAAPFLYRAWMRRAARRHRSHGHPIRIAFTDRQIVATYGDEVERVDYAAIRCVDERPRHLLFWTQARTAVILPKRAFAGENGTLDAIRERIGKGNAVEPSDASPPAKPPEPAAGSGSARLPWVARTTSDPVFQAEVKPTLEDHLAVDYADGRPVNALFVIGTTVLLMVGVAAYRSQDSFEARDFGTLAVALAFGLVAGAAIGWVLVAVLRRALLSLIRFGLRTEGQIGTPYRFEANREGIELTGGGIDTHIAWTSLIDIERDAMRYFFWLSVTKAVVVPLDAFADDSRRQSFEQWIATWYGRAPRNPPRMVRERTPPPDRDEVAVRRDAETPFAKETE